MKISILLFLQLLIPKINNSTEYERPCNIYHFTACSFVSTAVVFQVPGSRTRKTNEITVPIRGDISNASRLLVRKNERDHLSLVLKKAVPTLLSAFRTRVKRFLFIFLHTVPAGRKN